MSSAGSPGGFQIPLASTNQTFRVNLSGTTYSMAIIWRDAADAGWVLDIYDSTGTIPLIRGIPLVTGADLLAQYGYLDFGGTLTVSTDDNPDAVPTFDNLGVQSNLTWTPDGPAIST